MHGFVIFAFGLLFSASFALSVIGVPDTAESIVVVDFEKTFFDEYVKNENKQNSSLDQLVNTIIDQKLEIKLVDIPKAKNVHRCLQCRAAATTILEYKKAAKSDDFLEETAIRLCKLLKTAPSDIVCEGMVKLNRPMISYIVTNKPGLLAKQVCAVAFLWEHCYDGEDTFEDIKVRIDEKPTNESALNSNEIHKNETLTILHLTDIHYDPHYAIGGNAVCHNGACCKDNQGPPDTPTSAAGWWGDYRQCDTPWHAVVDGVQHIKRQHPHIDLIYFTGDIIDHFVWETTEQGNHDTIDQVLSYLKLEFGSLPLFPAIGNHEAHPANLFAPNNSDHFYTETQRLYSQMSEIWTKNKWLPLDTENTVLFGGFYTTLVRSGFRVITLNNNVCYGHNWWILYDVSYLEEQLQWLQDTLHNAENEKEVVHILAHVPSNDLLCYKPWTKVYRKIVERYASIIKAQFNGHSHVDEFNLYYSQKPGDAAPFSVAWNGGSLTTFSNLNPNYRVYHVDSESLEVLEHETWIYNLTEANQAPEKNPRWYKEYSFKEFYRLPDLSLSSLHGLVKGFGTNETRMRDYWTLKIKHADPQLKVGANLQQLREHFCEIVLVEQGDRAKCDELWKLT